MVYQYIGTVPMKHEVVLNCVFSGVLVVKVSLKTSMDVPGYLQTFSKLFKYKSVIN